MLTVWTTRLSKTAAMLGWGILLGALATDATALSADIQATARQYLDRIGVQRGICVLVATEPADLAIGIASQSELIYYYSPRELFPPHPARRWREKHGAAVTNRLDAQS